MSPRRSLVSLVVAAALSLPVTGHAQTPVKPFQDMSASAQSMRDSLVALARAQIGKKYVWGGTTPERGFDCSGLVTYVLAALHLEVPRTAAKQASAGTSVLKDTSALKPGDLLLFGKEKSGASHVGIYVGDGRYIQASSVVGRVIESPLKEDGPITRITKVWQSARRILALDDTTTKK